MNSSQQTKKEWLSLRTLTFHLGGLWILIGCLVLFHQNHERPVDNLIQNDQPFARRRLSIKQENEEQRTEALSKFQLANFTVLGASSFPKPSAVIGKGAVPQITPVFGQHRASEDAVFILSAEYGLNTYVTFVTTLRKAGFTGDIVMGLAHLDWKQEQVREYLTHQKGVVVYVLELKCFNAEMQQVDSAKGGMRVCKFDDLYTLNGKPVKDPRDSRTLQTSRYELYWIWSLHYDLHSWILLLDARDSFFQSNPFARVPRETDPNRADGILHFFGENMDATRIGLSPKNRKWLTNAYGDMVVSALQNKPTICSGSTMGEQVALETYLRAMVAESDETGVKLMGADQGFHNYLYYSNKLAQATTIRGISVFEQGYGTINNLGAMRTKPLEEWGNGKIVRTHNETSMVVLNWDGVPSPIVHQFDRHKVLSVYVYKTLTNQYKQEWREQQETMKGKASK